MSYEAFNIVLSINSYLWVNNIRNMNYNCSNTQVVKINLYVLF